jgi:hypothetical protein
MAGLRHIKWDPCEYRRLSPRDSTCTRTDDCMTLQHIHKGSSADHMSRRPQLESLMVGQNRVMMASQALFHGKPLQVAREKGGMW